ncbi:DUF968 domain-containing protein [Providencia rettgeri]|uniref:DUF968 domain-containing protein n=1 Tax=Providencia rettgeri TaxID=587 RepID=UPI00141A3C53|nr:MULTISPECIES: DUF968 domain-containing protein [Providencia]ELR5145906.1 DUF968 domain-containing protein [Providencia rettgeri]ELT5686677.1 DUF968 domain-containing protein [Providencia rettgeri]MBN6350990.1 DUF968 domain-containing protein [Providencia rettgeri]MDH2322921.1 DUF968 domain-containing protein [Providencia rettgeri]NIA45362.1 DUF968 domain-containing protein [Providencia rettgeri]
MSHKWILTPIIIPEVNAVMFKPGVSLNLFNGRMLITTLPDELKHQPSGLISLADQYLSDVVNDERASKPVLNLTINPEPPASLMLKPKLQRWINDNYLQWVKSQPCCVCNSIAHEAHHLIGHGQGGMGTKAHDLFTIPLCRIHHSELHKDPNGWESEHGSQLYFLFRFLDRSAALGVFG